MVMRLSINDLVVGYGNKVIINGLTVEFSEGKSVILGPNGSGKTTLLRAIAGVLRPIRGSITLDGKPLRKGDVGYVSHAGGLDPNMTVRDNLEFYTEIKGADNLDKIIDDLGIRGLLNSKVGSLSNGQRRIVEVAVAMLGNPRVYIFDELTEGLDVNYARRVREIVRKLGGIVIYTTHIPSEVFEVADDVLILKRGRLVFRGDLSRLGGTMKIIARRGRETRVVEVDANEVRNAMDELRSVGFEVLEVRNTVIEELLGEDNV
ncbi:MAG: ABC transporter ATP-binding protein [Vulcanisaeta sp.]